MNYRLLNYTCGIASISIYPTVSYQEALAHAQHLVAARAQAEGLAEAEALRRYFVERRAGQVAYLVTTLGLLLLTAVLSHQVAEGVLYLLAVAPGVIYLLALAYSHRSQSFRETAVTPDSHRLPGDSTQYMP